MTYIIGLFFALIQCFMLLHYLTYIQAAGYSVSMKGKFASAVYLHWILILSSGILLMLIYALVKSTLVFEIINLAIFVALATFLIVKYMLKRNKAVFTRRARRLYILWLIPAVASYLTVLIDSIFYSTLLMMLILFMCPLIALLLFKAIEPAEKRNNQRYVENAKQKLAAMPLLTKIGITGSYGKTSCKNILAKMLEKGYKVYATQGNYNTPLGISRSVEDMPEDTDIFIAEMGARKLGDITELVDIVRPQCGILTGLAEQHLETFGGFQNICNEKLQLLKGLPMDGIGVVNGNDLNAKAMVGSFKAKAYVAGFDKKYCDIYAENIKALSTDGCSFDLTVKGRTVSCKTRLIGIHNVENILLCVAVATYYNISLEDICDAISELAPIKHRMEVIETNKLVIIDDSYNCNIKGAANAMKLLQTVDKRVVVFSQGIVEGGAKAGLMNTKLGEMIARAADAVIVCGRNKEYIKLGLRSAGFSGEIFEFKNLVEAQKSFSKILNDGDLLYLQNDIPDNI